MSAQTAIRQYDDYILGKAPFYLHASSGKDNKDIPKAQQRMLAAKEKEKDALSVVRYIIRDILKWTPQEAMEHIDKETVTRTKMDVLLKYIDCPMEVQKSDDYQWVVHKAFPAETKYDSTEQLFRLYDKVLSGQIKKFPRNFFVGEEGFRKVGLLFRSYISRGVPASSIEDLYSIFSDNARGWKIIREAHLFYEVAPLYSRPLEFLHDTLGAEADDLLYAVYQYKAALQELRKQSR